VQLAAKPLPVAPAGTVVELSRRADRKSSQKPFFMCGGRAFGCVPIAISKSGD
jgi:hypothetical protein